MNDANSVSKITHVKIEEAKKVTTYDLSKRENGFLIELFKDYEGKKTEVYLTCAKPGSFKGYHEHSVRGSRYVCVKGTMKIILYVGGKREEHILTSNPPMRLFIPPHVPTGLENISTEDAWLINYPDPAYDPDLTDEQADYSEEELEKKYT
ncbi:MAG: FdtA/QdtA family cupin domain-containing protein [Candidatus Roizmanbacteria bacterium]|nr:FdtA/QdtA family cupin domain-containing protein [Candidatus Roizmanbacteria bacterium]